jgi:glutathione peroxidase
LNQRASTSEDLDVSIYDVPLRTLDGQPANLADYKDQALLIVNVASKCGFTPQYAGLQELHDRYNARGFAVLGFPCNQFLFQEPGGPDSITACGTQIRSASV